MQKILISGAGIAGLTAAYWLRQYGYHVELIDRVSDLEVREGYAVDFWGPGLEVAKEMNIIPQLEEIHLGYKRINFYNQHGNLGSSLQIEQLLKLYPAGFFTVLRGGLEKILLSKLDTEVKLSLGKTISNIINYDDRVKVEFSDNSGGEYDYLIAAEGIHSQVRKLLWGDEDKFSVDLGYQVAAFMVTASNNLNATVKMYNGPKRSITLMPVNQRRMAAYGIFKNDIAAAKLDTPLDRMRAAFADFPENITDLLENLTADNLFHDTVAQIEVEPWHKKRVILLGDACQCLTLVAGQGASMAMASAYSLALDLKNNNIDNYPKRMQPIISDKQKAARGFCKAFVPSTNLGIMFRDIAMRLMRYPWLARIFLAKMLREDWRISSVKKD